MNATLWCGCWLRLLDIVSQMFLTGEDNIPTASKTANHCFEFSTKKGACHFELSQQIFKCFVLVCTYKQSISCFLRSKITLAFSQVKKPLIEETAMSKT